MRRDLHEYEVRTFDALSQVWLTLDEPVATLQAARRVLDLVPFRESGHARVMEVPSRLRRPGRGGTGLRASLRHAEETMGLSPNEQTEELYAQALG
ncbi:MAG TPA: hypothetical protein VMP13_02555 [Acidimicrobiia bacterium]|nr:hypothetical protein [Acidimicrobiia bacterium]